MLWKCFLQTEIAFSTMEAEYVVLSTSCKDLFPILYKVKELSSAVGLSDSNVVNIYIKVYENNAGALTLTGLKQCQMTQRSKHHAVKYHWFREHVKKAKDQAYKS